MSLNREQKGKIALGVLGVLAAYMVYSNLLSGPDIPASTSSAPRPSAAPAGPVYPASDPVVPRPGMPSRSARGDDFHPILHPKRQEDRLDPRTIDPKIKLDLLAKVMAVEASGGNRNLFAFGPAPSKPVELAGEGPIVRPKMGPFPAPPPPPPPPDPATLPPPPINLKFYGFSTVRRDGKKTAYFLDGDDIFIAAEGDTLKRRYKLLRISPTSVLMEDMENKRQQSLPLAPEAQS